VQDARIYDARLAAQAFVNQYLTASGLPSVRNLGVVAFNSDATVKISLQQVNAGMNTAIGGITAPSGDRRFTNIEGGLLLAQRMLDASSSKHKFVILITDGFPTTYTTTASKNQAGIHQMTGYDTYDANGTIFRDRVQTKPVAYGCDYSDEAAIRTRKQAAAMKSTTYRPMDKAVVIDPMGEKAEFMGFYNKSGRVPGRDAAAEAMLVFFRRMVCVLLFFCYG